MKIQFRYEKSDRYSDGFIEVFANEAQIGILSSNAVPEQLEWDPDIEHNNARFQFRKEETFNEVVNELKRYKNEKGFRYLTICRYNNGYMAQLDKDMLERAGFKILPDKHPAFMYLE